MASVDEQILRTAKEILVKFIEVGRVSPSSCHDLFREIYNTVHDSVKGNTDAPEKKDDVESEEKD